MELTSLRDLFVEELKDLYSAENQIIKALPKMAKKASNGDLAISFEEHMEQTRAHIERLERILDRIGSSPKGRKCAGMEGLLEEGKDIMSADSNSDVMDAALIGAAQKVEHYEIACYGTVRTYAQLLGDDESARLLQQTLDEEGETDKKLTRLAQSSINVQAVHGETTE